MKLYGLIGKSLSHSPSAKLLNACFKKLGLSHRYLLFQVEKPHLKNLVLCMKLVDIFGLNITAPYKEAVIPFLDRLDRSAKLAGAVNTIVRQKNKFVGFNTDGAGFVEAMQEQAQISPKGKSVVILGAGGAARGVASYLAQGGARQIIILNRTLSHAKRVLITLKKHFPKTHWEAAPLSQKSFRDFFPETEILIQATSTELMPPLPILPKRALVSDILYHPLETKMLQRAKQLNLKWMDGLWMLVDQANLNLKLWTGKKLDPHWLRQKVLAARP